MMLFEVRVAGDWTAELAERFADLEANPANGCIVLSADLDQAGLHGLLERVRVSGLELVDIRRARQPPRTASEQGPALSG